MQRQGLIDGLPKRFKFHTDEGILSLSSRTTDALWLYNNKFYTPRYGDPEVSESSETRAVFERKLQRFRNACITTNFYAIKSLYEENGSRMFYLFGTKPIHTLLYKRWNFTDGRKSHPQKQELIEIVKWLIEKRAYGDYIWNMLQDEIFMHGPKIEIIQLLLDANIYKMSDPLFCEVGKSLKQSMQTAGVESETIEPWIAAYNEFLFSYTRRSAHTHKKQQRDENDSFISEFETL